MTRLLLAALCAAALSGCASAPAQVVTQRVEIPVPVRAIDPAKVPAKPESRLEATPKSAPLDDQVRALLIDREKMEGYAGKLRALVEAAIKD